MPSVTKSAPPAQPATLKILSLTAENILKLSAVQIDTDGASAVVIAGENEAGKSAVLAAIEMALGGEKRLPLEPIRRGQEKARVILDLGDIIVSRTITAAGSVLKVTNREGAAYPSPQALLDGLVSKLTFDPLAFAEADEKTQGETLRRLAGINTDDLEDLRKQVYDERTLINRELTNARGALSKATKHAGVGTTLTDAADIAAALTAADKKVDAAAGLTAAADRADAAVTGAKANAASAQERVERLRQELESAETASLEADHAVFTATEAAGLAREKATVAAGDLPNRDALRQQMAAVEVTNGMVRDNLAYAELAQLVKVKETESERLTGQLHTIEATKVDRLASATFPVEGLGLNDAGVTWNGLPFSQASTAIRIRASAAIGFALNPRLKILRIKNGNDLGAKNLHLLAEAAAAVGGQVWIERIAGGDGLCTVLIEDGNVIAQSADVVTA